MAEIETKIETATPVLIYIKPTCPFCKKALTLLEATGFTDITVKDIAAQPELRAEMIEKAGGRKTVPQIFFGEGENPYAQHIGGCDDVHDYLEQAFSNEGMFCTLG